MPPRPGPAQVAVGNRLREYRKAANVSGVELARRMGLSQSWVSRVESGDRRISVADAHRWLDHVQAAPSARDEFVDLISRADIETVAWADVYAQGQEAQQRGYDDLERTATAVRLYQDSVIPGVLQTAGYAANWRRQILGMDDEQVGIGVAAQLRRQEALYRPGADFSVVVTESVLRRRASGPAVMAEQLNHLATLANLPTLELRILPVDHDMVPVWGGSYDIYHLADEGDSIVLVELKTRELRETNPDAVAEYERQFQLVRAAALSTTASVELIRRLADQYTEQAFR